MPCRAIQDRRFIVESSGKTWSTEEGNGKTLQYSSLENPMNSMKKQEDMTLKDELPRSIGAQYRGRFKREGTYEYPWLIHADVRQKPAQLCKAIILQLKINNFFKKKNSHKNLM